MALHQKWQNKIILINTSIILFRWQCAITHSHCFSKCEICDRDQAIKWEARMKEEERINTLFLKNDCTMQIQTIWRAHFVMQIGIFTIKTK